MSLEGRDRIFVALDSPDEERILGLARLLRGRVGGFKVGLEAFTANGPALVRKVADQGIPVFLDLKLHDIPNTVAGAAAAAARLGVSFLTVHALGGARMIRAAVDASGEAAANAGLPSPVILAVTILTSHDDVELGSLGVAGPCADAVRRLASIAHEAGAQGLVCSAEEIAIARLAHPRGVLVVPGIRPAGAAAHDQSRTATPAQAIARGADRLVVGRPITGAPDPAAAADAIAREADAGVDP